MYDDVDNRVMPAYKSLDIKWKIMDAATRILFLLILCGNVDAKAWNPTIIAQGNNGIIYIDMPKRNGETYLEINFHGYTSNRHFTNILLYMSGKNENISINNNYTGRIERVVNSNNQLSFLLLNVVFNDSGSYTIKENSDVKETTCVLVTSRIYEAKLWEPLLFSFIVDVNNTSYIIVEKQIPKLSQPVVMYNVTYNICTYIDVVSGENKSIENCVLINRNFSYIIPDIGWLHKGSYFAWDDKGRLLDSIFLDIQGNNMTGSVETRSGLDTETSAFNKEFWLIFSAIGITIVCACLVVVAVCKLRVKKARMSTMDNSTSRRGILTVDHRSNNAFIPEETRRVPMKQNSNDLTELTTKQLQAKFNLNNQNMCLRGLGCSKSSVNTRCNLQFDSSLSSAETMQSDSTHRYDYVHDIDELMSVCQSNQNYIRSNLSDRKSIGGKSQTSFEYSYAVQRRFMTLRPPAPEPVLKKKLNQQNMVANSFYSHKQVNKRSIRRYDPSIVFARKNNQGTMESHRTRSSDDLSLNFTNVVLSPSFVHLDKDFAKKDVDLPLKDSKPGIASQCLRADYPGDDYDQAYAMKRRHRRSWSNDALYGDRIFNIKAPRPRRFSSNICTDENYYDCLNT